MNSKDICIKCKAECCKKYWITLLPFEAERIAKYLNISLKEFIKEYCVFHLRLIKTGLKEIKMPSIALKRVNSNCVFLSDDFTCSIYSARPKACRMFPFLSIEETDLKKLYPFCLLLNYKTQKNSFDEKYYSKVKNYFNEIEKKTFKNIWPFIPEKGVLIEKRKERMISRKEFLKFIA